MGLSLKRIRIASLLILILGLAAGFFAASHLAVVRQLFPLGPLMRPFRLGLDLQGGTHLVYRADFSNFPGGSRVEAMTGLRDVIERRVNLFGVTEPVVQVQTSGEEYRLIVELAGVRDIREAIRLIGETPFLEFRQARRPEESRQILDAFSQGVGVDVDPYFILTELNGRYLKRAELQFDPTTSSPLIGVEFNDEGALLLERITQESIGRPLGIYLDGALLSAPTVQEKISEGRAQITGRFTLGEARDLVRRLNSGALPVPIVLVSQQSVEASLGASSLLLSLHASLIGLAAVAAFMLLWYRLPGLVAVAALGIYVALVLALFKLIPVTLTAAGIAGFVLSVGMAVDANILIFERTKEELRRGRELGPAIDEGFRRAWTSIRDSNVSSLITTAILYWLGTSIVRGFALTLAIGILMSIFSAVWVSRIFLLAMATPKLARYRFLFMNGLST